MRRVNLSVGTITTVTISDIAFGGDGVARLDDLVIFVPFVALGELVEIEITELKKNFARARLRSVISPSPDRVPPPCPYYGICGGCQYQHVAYPAQLLLKHKQIVDLFQRVGKFPAALIAPVIGCPSPYGYRNRIMVRTQWDKFKQALNIGFLRAESRLVVDIEECKIAHEILNREIQRVRKNPPARGGLKVVLRIPPEGWDLPGDSFFQNNFELLPKLVETVRERLRDARSRYLIDTYCGVGFFSVELGDLVEKFAGVEVDRPAIAAAKKNAARRGLTNGEFIGGRTEELLPGLIGRFDRSATTVILDPPRTGCPPETMQLLERVRPSQIIYISCHPATLARDLNVLCSSGVFKLTKVVPLDMFPQTQHVECVADLRACTEESVADILPTVSNSN